MKFTGTDDLDGFEACNLYVHFVCTQSVCMLHYDGIDDDVVANVCSCSSCLSCQYGYRNFLTQKLTVKQSGTVGTCLLHSFLVARNC